VAALVHRLRRAVAPTDTTSQAGDNIARRRRRLANPLVRLAWSWSIAADQVVSYWLRAYLPAVLGRVVIADRYVYDTAVELDASLPADAHWSRRAIQAMLSLTPRPRLAYVLDVSSEGAKARKPHEAWHSDFEGERRQYRELAEHLRLRLLSTECAFADANDPLIREVMMTYMAGYETWLNGLFFANPSQKNAPDLVWARGAVQ
jgi:thymidylate kinase